jgi:hypothetical protein
LSVRRGWSAAAVGCAEQPTVEKMDELDQAIAEAILAVWRVVGCLFYLLVLFCLAYIFGGGQH